MTPTDKKDLFTIHSKAIYVILFFSIIIFNILFLTGCSNDNDNPVNPSRPVTITGKVTDYWGNGIPNLKIELDSVIILSSSNGSFTFSNIRIPYDINVYIDPSNVESFRNLTITNPIIPIDNPNSNKTYNANITVIIPPFNNNQRAEAIFYDNSGMYRSEENLSNTYYTTFNHEWNGSSSTSGKLVIWVYTTSQGKIISYEKYGEKPLTITNGVAARMVFNDIDLGTNPYDSSISGTASISPGFVIEDIIIGMNRIPFANFYEYGHRNFDVEINNLNFSAFIPVLNGNVYKYYAWMQIYEPAKSRRGTKVAEIILNNYNNFGFNTFPSLISPEDNALNVNYNTIFSFSKDSPQGIYNIRLMYLKNGLYFSRTIYLNSETFRLSPLSDTLYNIPDITECSWSVMKITGYQNTDDFVSIPPGINPKYNELLASEQRTFTTKLNNK